MKKLFILSLLAMFVFVVPAYAADWSVYESGRNNIRLDGYDSQPGYIAFTGGDNVIRAYLFVDDYGRLRIIPRVSDGSESTGAHDLTTTKITNTAGYTVTDTRP